MSTSTMNAMDCSPSVTFDSNVIEVVLDDEKRIGDAAKRVFHALQSGIIKGFVARSYFAHDAIKRGGRINALCGGIEFLIPSNPLLYQRGLGLRVVQTSTTELNSYNEKTINLMQALNMNVLEFRRALWPEVAIELPLLDPPVDYNTRIKVMREVIEDEYHCGFYRFRQFLKQVVGNEGSDLSLLMQLKEREFSKAAFNVAFAEAADGDALIAHYGYGIDYFCTNDEASKAGEQSVFSPLHRNVLHDKFNVKIVSLPQLAEIIKESKGGARHG